MAEEQLFAVNDVAVSPATRLTLADAGLQERGHLQEWVLAHPEILGDDVRIVTCEFDRWATATGEATWERLDVLALDRTGGLVLAELKRGRAPDAVLVQALKYAAMASRFNLDELAEVAAHHDAGLSVDEILQQWRDWAPNLSDESLSPPRIVVVAEDFGSVLTNTAMFLIEQGLDLRLVRIQLYRLGDVLALTTSQLLPVPETEEFMVRPRSGAATQRAARTAAKRRGSVTERLVAAGVLEDGAELRICVPSGVHENRDAIAAWLEDEPRRAVARWINDPSAPVQWQADDAAYSFAALIREIIQEATGDAPRTSVWGPNWFRTRDDQPLHKIAEALPDDAASGRAPFDWTEAHDVLAALPRGRWTTYGDVAALVGTGAQAFGQHVTTCPRCENAHRVLGKGGRPRPNFRWDDPDDDRSQQEALEEEGVSFTDGCADPSRQLHSEDLRRLAAANSDGEQEA